MNEAESAHLGNPQVSSAHVLAVDDDPSVRQMIADYLAQNEIRVTTVANGSGIARVVDGGSIDVVLLDLRLPGEDGMHIARRLRETSDIPLIMLTACKEEADRVMGLELGADDYLTKPFEMMELLARIEARLRRHAPKDTVDAEAYRFGAVQVDFRKAEVTKDGVPVELSAREYQLLRYFIEHRGATISRDELLNHVWGYHAMPNTRTVDVHVAWLRQKIEPNPKHPQYVITAHGLGYKFAG